MALRCSEEICPNKFQALADEILDELHSTDDLAWHIQSWTVHGELTSSKNTRGFRVAFYSKTN